MPSRSISASRPACDEEDRPSTATIAAMPIAMPRADSGGAQPCGCAARRWRPGRGRRTAAARGTGLWSVLTRSAPAAHEAGRRGRCRRRSRPSSISTCAGQRAASSRSWVITTIVAPSRWSSSSSARIDSPVALSRLPVGSSARTIAGRPTSARAMATRWRSPPDSWVGPARGAGGRGRPRASASAAAAAALAERHARVEQAVGDVVEPVGARRGRTAGTRTRCACARSAGELRSDRSSVSRPVMRTRAAGRAVEGAEQVQQRRLARSRTGRAIGDQLALVDGEADAAQRLDRRIPG